MMIFSTDRDLLAAEPTIFEDLPTLAQPRISVNDAEVTGTTLTSAAANFIAAQIDPGYVLMIAGVPHEVITRVDAHTLAVSLLRTRIFDAAIPGTQGTGLTLAAQTFAPQAALVHDTLLAMLGVKDDAIISVSVMARLETLGVLERLYSAAGTLLAGGWRDTFLLKADDYRRRYGEALRRAKVMVDLDGDGLSDRRIEFGVNRLIRV